MKKYEILVHGPAANDYIMGRISGIIYALSGMPEKEYAWKIESDGLDCLLIYEATEEQHLTITRCVYHLYPKAYVGARSLE